MWLQTPWPSTHPVLRASLSLLETASSSSRHEISSPFDMAVHCTVCPETFSSPRELKRHARTHGKEKLFECGICNKKFKSKGSLPNHLKTHTGEKPFECAICSKRFYQKVNLKMECPECLERFDSSEHRPKSLPCGHSFCLRCLRQLRVRTCPADSLVFQSSPEALPDNLIVLQACKKPVDNTLCRLWCRSCSMNATEDCVDEHSAAVCSLKKLRSERRLEAPAAPPVSRVADIAESASTEAPVPSRSTMPPLPSTHPSGSLVTTSEDCDLEADSQECSSLDAFPDELLLMILSELRDCELLLDVVPRVCSRWRALARDPRVWADIRVKPVNPVGAARNDPRAYLLPARTILRAPALRSLHFPWMFDMPLANDTLHSALRRCQAAVGELHLDNGGGVCSRVARRLGEGGRSALGCLLRRSGAALRALSLGDALLPELWSRRTSPFRSSDRPRIPVVLNALPGLTRLQDLSLRVHDMTRYHGQLAGGVLKLRRLCLAYHHTAGPAAFARDLVAGAADTLRSLELLPMDADSYHRVGLPAAVLEAVALCGGLESLHITLTDMAVVRAMPRLGTLRLLVPRDWYLSPDGFLASEVFVRVLGELKDCRPLAHLSRLELCTGPRSKSTPEKLPVDWDTFFSFEAEAVFRALGRLAAAATILHLRLSPFAPTLCMYDLLSGMYRVREVYLRPNDTVLKAALPELGVKLFRSE